ncbi:MAG: Uma2 family endonuclease, partial [Gloeomargarita sp. SKYG116]|nr:Uma2 family endonuclease [Gloeomargarita sp. SKYG116]MDW8400745.1 Uma2 family endonuclease [Gloeomargarita sp. SKYGB_i_bin116]
MTASLPLRIPPTLQWTEQEFEEWVKANPDLRWELTADGKLLAMPPTGGETGNYEIRIATEIELWNRRYRLGKTFSSSTGFRLPNGAIRSPDVAWIPNEKWERLSAEQRRGFAPLCPDFVVELLSPSDDKALVQAKMEEYMTNGARLGWLVDPHNRTVTIYRPGQPPETQDFTTPLTGESV